MVKNEWLNQNENNDEKIYNRGNAVLGLCSWVKAQKIDVRIRVVDEWNRPLQGVMMRIGGNDDESFLSDKDGMIECRADKGAELNFEKYNQLQRKLKVTGEVMTVKLDKDNRLFELGYDQRVTKENTTAAIDGVSADEMKLSGDITLGADKAELIKRADEKDFFFKMRGRKNERLD